MHAPNSIHIWPLTEEVFDEVIESAGGRRAHPDQDRRTVRGADYILGDALIELKVLEDDGLEKPERQKKLVALFEALDPGKPVHVLDPERLDAAGRREYDRAIEGPLKSAVRSAKGQLAQSRIEYPNALLSILMIVNNGNSALNHDEIVQLASRRVRNDTDKVDGVIVAGAYLHGDDFDAFALWPCSYVPIHLNVDFPDFEAFRKAFGDYAERSMTAALIDGHSQTMTKGPALDTGFDIDGTTFLKPAPALGNKSPIHANGRPRLNSTGIEKSPLVGVVFPEMSRKEWARFRELLPREPGLGNTYQDWLQEREHAFTQGTLLQPLVPVPITLEGWLAFLNGDSSEGTFQSICDFATHEFQRQVLELIEGAKSADEATVLPSRHILAFTEEIGQDEANDVSQILLVEHTPSFEPRTTILVRHARIFHRHACTLGAAYAVKHGVGAMLWQKDLTYAWI